jgi:hypothetical protein
MGGLSPRAVDCDGGFCGVIERGNCCRRRSVSFAED